MKCDTVLLLLSLSFLHIVYSFENCCKNRIGYQQVIPTCDDGKIVLPKCDGSRSKLSNLWSDEFKYSIHDDSIGEYLKSYNSGDIIRSPHFCVGDIKWYFGGVDEVAIICDTHREHYSNLQIPIDESDNDESYFAYFKWFAIFFNVLSCSLLAIAVYVYCLVIPIRQIEDDCLLNVAGSLFLAHAASFYSTVSVDGVLPDLCNTSLYITYYSALSAFVWYALFMYYLSKKYKSGISLEQEVALKQFRIIGYGAPALLIILVNIHAHASKFYSENQFEQDCLSHQILMEDIYIFAPVILAIGTNVFFWKNLEKHSEIMQIKTTEDDSIKKKINSLVTLNQRLFLVLAFPWLAYIIVYGTSEVIYSNTFALLGLGIKTTIDCAGGIVALILVMSRARVWTCVTHKYENCEWLHKWQPSDQEEISTLCKNGSFNVSQASPSDI